TGRPGRVVPGGVERVDVGHELGRDPVEHRLVAGHDVVDRGRQRRRLARRGDDGLAVGCPLELAAGAVDAEHAGAAHHRSPPDVDVDVPARLWAGVGPGQLGELTDQLVALVAQVVGDVGAAGDRVVELGDLLGERVHVDGEI